MRPVRYSAVGKLVLLLRVWAVWRRFPELRLGQLLVNATTAGRDERCPSVFFVPDEDLIDRLRTFHAAHGHRDVG